MVQTRINGACMGLRLPRPSKDRISGQDWQSIAPPRGGSIFFKFGRQIQRQIQGRRLYWHCPFKLAVTWPRYLGKKVRSRSVVGWHQQQVILAPGSSNFGYGSLRDWRSICLHNQEYLTNCRKGQSRKSVRVGKVSGKCPSRHFWSVRHCFKLTIKSTLGSITLIMM
jgi:hypothetical protein